MSRGPGRVQRAVRAALEAEPHRLFTVEELAGIAFPGERIEAKHRVSVLRALSRLPIDFHSYASSNRYLEGHRSGRGWHRRVRLSAF